MINTLNESSLHKSLKTLFSLEKGDRTEVEENGFYYDVVKANGDIIEIQTQNLSKLLEKAQVSISKNRKFQIIYPLSVEKFIKTVDEKGNEISKSKRPSKKTIYDAFKEMTGLAPVLMNENFSIKILFCNILETRQKTATPVQTLNKRRRFKKDWLKIDKKLIEISGETNLSKKEDYISLLPATLNKTWTINDFNEEINKTQKMTKTQCKAISYFLWVLTKTGVLTRCGKKGNAYLYKVSK